MYECQESTEVTVQGSKHISEYIKEAQSLSLKVPKELDEVLAMAFIGSMLDQVKERVSFTVAGEADRSSGLKFSRVVELVKSAYMMIGEQPGVGKYSGEEKHGGGATVMTAALVAPDKLDEIIKLLKGLQEFMLRGAISMSDTQAMVPFTLPAMQQQQGRIANPNVTCYNCGMKGHYSTTCTNPALSSAKQRAIREQVMAQTPDPRARIAALAALPMVIHPSQTANGHLSSMVPPVDQRVVKQASRLDKVTNVVSLAFKVPNEGSPAKVLKMKGENPTFVGVADQPSGDVEDPPFPEGFKTAVGAEEVQLDGSKMPTNKTKQGKAKQRDVPQQRDAPQQRDVLQQRAKNVPRRSQVITVACRIDQAPREATHASGDTDECHPMFIGVWVGKTKITSVLVDSGSLIDADVAKQLDLPIHEDMSTDIVLANNAVTKVNKYVWANANVVGVVAKMKSYLLDIDQSYTILLSRRWLRRVKAVEDYGANSLVIEGGVAVRRTVLGVPADMSGVEIFQNAVEFSNDVSESDNEEDDGEEAIDKLLDELEALEYEKDMQDEKAAKGRQGYSWQRRKKHWVKCVGVKESRLEQWGDNVFVGSVRVAYRKS